MLIFLFPTRLPSIFFLKIRNKLLLANVFDLYQNLKYNSKIVTFFVRIKIG